MPAHGRGDVHGRSPRRAAAVRAGAGQHTVALPELETAKVLLWNEMMSRKLRKADLARLLGVHQPQVDRLFDRHHSSKLDFVEQAASALGRRLTVELA